MYTQKCTPEWGAGQVSKEFFIVRFSPALPIRECICGYTCSPRTHSRRPGLHAISLIREREQLFMELVNRHHSVTLDGLGSLSITHPLWASFSRPIRAPDGYCFLMH